MQLGPKVNNVNKSGLVSMGRTVNVLRNINFDNTQFQVTNIGNGLNVTITKEFGDTFPWDKILFGYSIDVNIITILAGEIHFRDIIYPVAQTDLTIAATDTYAYVEMEWGTGTTSIKQTTDLATATTSSSCYRKWLYLLTYTAPSTVEIKTIGHLGGAIDIMPVFG